MDLLRTGGHGTRVPALVLLCAAFVFAATNAISCVFFDHVPHVHDEIAYLFQAKIFSLGKVAVASPSPREAFDFPHVVNNGRWYSQYPPGFPLLLMLGWILGMPWVVNPILAALSAIVLYLLGKEIYGEAEGRLAAVLGAFSLWFLLMSSTMLSHTGSMLFYALFLLFSFRSLAFPSFRNGLAAGASLGMAFLIRPFNAAAIAAPLLAFCGIRFIRTRQRSGRALAGLALALFASAAVLLVYNQVTNGHPLRLGYMERYGEAHGLGFGKAGYMGIPHSPKIGFSLFGENMTAIHKYLFGWPLSSLVLLVPFLVPWKDEKRKRGADLLLLMSFFALILGLFFYWGTQVYIGARMYFEAFPILILITSRGVTRTPAFLSSIARSVDIRFAQKAVRVFLALMMIYAFAVTFPRWVRPSGTRDYDRVFTHDFCGVGPGLGRAIDRARLGRSLVILKLLYTPKPYFPDSWWGSGFIRNDPKLHNEVIYAQDRGPLNAQLLRVFPDRKIYLYIGTLDKGMLLPVEDESGRIRLGQPVVSDPDGEKAPALVGSPPELFTSYSESFGRHIEAVFQEHLPDEIDVPRLSSMAAEDEAAGNLQAAVFDLEAALQIENDTAVRVRLLGRLAPLYFKTGNTSLAKLIQARLADPYDLRVYDVCPEKGF